MRLESCASHVHNGEVAVIACVLHSKSLDKQEQAFIDEQSDVIKALMVEF